jgi:isoleucyl-tRNA synthetase
MFEARYLFSFKTIFLIILQFFQFLAILHIISKIENCDSDQYSLQKRAPVSSAEAAYHHSSSATIYVPYPLEDPADAGRAA